MENINPGIRFSLEDELDIDVFSSKDHVDFCTDSSEIIQINNNKIFINELYLKTLKEPDQSTFSCNLFDVGVEKIEIALTDQVGIRNLSSGLSDKERHIYNRCRKKIGPPGRRPNRPVSKCRDYKALFNKWDNFKKYRSRLKNLMYSTELEIDISSFSGSNLGRYNPCLKSYRPTTVTASGVSIKMIGLGVVYMGPGYQTSQLGHLGQRFIYCRNNKLVDIFLDYTQFSPGETNDLLRRYGDISHVKEEDYINGLTGKSYIKFQTNPASVKVYGEHQYKYNRDIFEVWPKYDEDIMYSFLKESIRNYKDQTQNIKSGTELPEYDLFAKNCVHPIKDQLEQLGYEFTGLFNGITPASIFKTTKQNAEKVILYPSQRTFRQMMMNEQGKSLLFENIRVLSTSSAGVKSHLGLLVYPEYRNSLRGLILKPISSLTNALYSVGDGIFNLSTGNLDGAKRGLDNFGISLFEIFGPRLRYPYSTPWTEAEQEYLFNKDRIIAPKVFNMVIDRIN